MSDWTVGKGAILGTSPMVLPAQCVECGRDASRETRVDTVLHWYPAWIIMSLERPPCRAGDPGVRIPLRSEKPKTACRSPVAEAGLLASFGRVRGNSGANTTASTPLIKATSTRTHQTGARPEVATVGSSRRDTSEGRRSAACRDRDGGRGHESCRVHPIWDVGCSRTERTR